MIEVVKRVDRFEAEQFTGGVESFVKIQTWLQDVEEVRLSMIPEYEAGEGVTSQGYLVVRGPDYTTHLPINTWLVLITPPSGRRWGGLLEFHEPEAFNNKYRVADGRD